MDTVNYQVRQSTRNVYVNKINAGSRRCALESRVIKCAWSSSTLRSARRCIRTRRFARPQAIFNKRPPNCTLYSVEEIRTRLVTQIDRLEELKIQLEFNRTAAQIDEAVEDGVVSLDNIQAIIEDAQRIAADLDLHRRGGL